MVALPAARLAALLGSWRGRGPAYQDLAGAIRVLVIDARVPAGTRLPSERALAEALDVSRTTTTRAYEELRERELLTSVRGSGSVVRLPLAESSMSVILETDVGDDTISLLQAARQAAPGLGAAYGRALEKLPALLSTTGYLPDGYRPLRELVAERYAAQGLPTDASQIIITAGAQGALAIVAAALVGRGDQVIVEACGYPHAFDTIAGVGGRLLPLPYTSTPWTTSDVRRTAPGSRLAVLVPDFHNPTSSLMPNEQREEITHVLRRSATTTVIDETLREVALDPIEVPAPYATFDADAVTVGSLSKILWGGLRIGWIRAPHHLVSQFVQTRMRLDMAAAAFDQIVAVEALRSDYQETNLVTIREQRDLLVSAVRERLPSFDVPVPAGGLSLWVGLPRRVSSRLVASAEGQGLRLLPGSRFYSSRAADGEGHVRLPFTEPQDVLLEAVERLGRAWDAVDETGTRPVRRSDERDAIDLIQG
ncbi:MAG: PLP-dependent aminotransferase family protein, partial [Solirubrobacteraceae bacterium]|nr:PLP-dependent aminotransferase family protein [Solirubrobacteraceae bacterium]